LHWYKAATGVAKQNALDQDDAKILLRSYRGNALLTLYKRKHRLGLWGQFALASLWKAIVDAGNLAPDNIGIQQGAIVVRVEVWHRCFIDLLESRRIDHLSGPAEIPKRPAEPSTTGVIGIRDDIAWLKNILMLPSGPSGS
jgi:hypothetical protein